MSTHFEQACRLAQSLRESGFVALLEGSLPEEDDTRRRNAFLPPDPLRNGDEFLYRFNRVAHVLREARCEDLIIRARTRVMGKNQPASPVAWSPEWAARAAYSVALMPCFNLGTAWREEAAPVIARIVEAREQEPFQAAILGAYALGGDQAVSDLLRGT